MSADVVEQTDVAVVGAGPIGIELAVGLKRAGIDYLQFDAKQIGYTISWFAPQTRFFSSNERIAIAGVPLQTPDQGKCTREQYLAYLRSVVEEFDLSVNTYEPVVGIERTGRGGEGDFLLTTRPASGAAAPRRYAARRLVLVTGGTDHPRKLNVPGEDLPHVSHYFDDPHRYFRKRLLIVGGKNSAVEAALRCHNAGAHVAISYRRPELPSRSIKYWLLPEINGLIESGRIEGYLGTVPTAIHPTHVTLDRSPLAGGDEDGNGQTPARRRGRMAPSFPVDVPADFVVALIGYEQDNTLLKLAGVELQGSCGAPAYDERTMETNVPGVYVAGTAVGGTQEKYTVFIENCHVHVERIVAALTGSAPPAAPAPLAQPES
jgi:thioredoxin reductase (NADPH)